jgi:hypothetical protein
VLLDDLAQDAAEGKDLPFGFTEDIIRKELLKIDDTITQHADVAEALTKRQDYWGRLKDDYVQAMKDIDIDVSSKFTRENYFRHQVLDYAQNPTLKGTGNALKAPSTTRGFLKQSCTHDKAYRK